MQIVLINGDEDYNNSDTDDENKGHNTDKRGIDAGQYATYENSYPSGGGYESSHTQADIGGGYGYGAYSPYAGYGISSGHGGGGQLIAQHVEVTKPIPVPVYKALTVPIPHPVPVAVPHPIPIHVPQPIPVQVPVPVPVVKTIAYPVEKPVPYPVEKPVHITVEKKVPYPVPKPYPVHIPVYRVKHIYHDLSKYHHHHPHYHH
ncbi:uncharacterized protein LOC142331712 [Lycorma delicatula]|uniref:uncharacterized protein LOC142331712 n=1 Tax=Lycorma delicatula TaxID=130591 RepID=UPI003F517886